MSSPLFKPFKLKSLDLPNRIVMAPMTRSHSPGDVPGDNVADYYARRAAADVGLIITEGTTVRRGGASNDPNVPNFYKADALAGWKSVVDRVHANHGHIAPQIWHQGMMRKPGSGPEPEAPTDGPSGVTHSGKQVLPEPSAAEVDDMVMAYAEAAGEGVEAYAAAHPPDSSSTTSAGRPVGSRVAPERSGSKVRARYSPQALMGS